MATMADEMRRRFTALMLCIILPLLVQAQELTVKSMELAPLDYSASQYRRLDTQDTPCALVKVRLAVPGAEFSGGIVGKVENKMNEYYVYMAEGIYRLYVKTPSYLPLDIDFRKLMGDPHFGVKSLATYKIVITAPDNNAADKPKQKLIINYSPKDAMVLIDSKPYPGNGLIETELPLGEHSYVIAANGYVTAEGTVKLNASGPCSFNQQLMKDPAVTDARAEPEHTSPDNNSDAPANRQPLATQDPEQQANNMDSAVKAEAGANELTLSQMILRPLVVLPDRDGMGREETKQALKAFNSQWEVLEDMGGKVHVHGFGKTYKGQSISSVWCDFDSRMYGKMSKYVYPFYFKKKNDAQSFFDALLRDMSSEGMSVTSRQDSGDSRSAKTSYKERQLVLKMLKFNGRNARYAVEFEVTPQNYKIITVGDVQFRMIHVEGGTFTMGSNDSRAEVERPEHQVTLTNDYYIGETEVTQELWKAVMGSNPSSYSLNSCPVERVSWEDCQMFLQKLNEMAKGAEGLTFRLPSEAEWEFAARGGNKSVSHEYAGGDSIADVAWYEGNSGNRIHSVGAKRANELGLFDMSGNVWEWCQDLYGSYEDAPQTNPKGAAGGSSRVVRGGGCSALEWSCRSLYRGDQAPSGRIKGHGLRLAL